MPAYRQGDEKRRGELSWAPGLSALAGLAQQVPRRRFPLREAGEVVKAREAPRSLCPPRAQCLGDEERWQAEERLQGADIIDLVLTSTARILVNCRFPRRGSGRDPAIRGGRIPEPSLALSPLRFQYARRLARAIER